MSGRHYDTLRVLDEAVAKAVKVREVARIARIETLMRQYLAVEWDRLARKAAKAAARAVRRGHARLTESDIKSVGRAADKVMERWAGKVALRFADDTARIYRLARQAGHKKGTGQTKASLQYESPEFPARVRDTERKEAEKEQARKAMPEADIAFDLIDKEAVEAMRKFQMFWIGQHYGANVSGVVSQTARETIVEAGHGQIAAGKEMEDAVRAALRRVQTPTKWGGTDKQYFEILAANAATVGRVQGQLKSFADLGFTEYEWTAAGGERMCKRCGLLDGKIFSVASGVKQVRAEMSARNPDDIRDIHPWPSEGALFEISNQRGHVGAKDSAAIAAAGMALPPLHGR